MILVLALCALIERVTAEETINIGALLALTGPYPLQGNAFREGIELAVDDLNTAGGINGKKIQIFLEDTANDPKNALTAAKKLVEQDRVVAAIMSSYPEYHTGGMELQRNKVPVIAIWDSSPEIDQMGDYIFGIGPWAPSSGEVSAQFAKRELKAKTAVVVTSIDPWAELVSNYFEKQFVADGGKILKRYALNPATSDFKPVLLSIKQKVPDVIYAPIIDNIPVFHKQKRELQISTPILSSDVISDEHIRAAPEAFEGAYQSRNKEPSMTDNQQLFDRYQKKFAKQVTMPWFVTVAYDAIMLHAQAMKAGALTGEAIKQYLYTIKGYHGATQEFSFTKEGSAPQMAVIFKISSGKLLFTWEP